MSKKHATPAQLRHREADRRRRATLARNPAFLRSSLVEAVDRSVSDESREAHEKRAQNERIRSLKRGVASLRTQVQKAAGRPVFKGVLRPRPKR